MLLTIVMGLTGLSDDNPVGYSRAVLVVSRTLVRSLISLRLLPADVNDQSPWTGLHQDFGVFLYIEVGPISRPGKTRTDKKYIIIITVFSSVLQVIKKHCGLFMQTESNHWFHGRKFDPAAAGKKTKKNQLCLIHSARCVSQVVSMTTVAPAIHISSRLQVKLPQETRKALKNERKISVGGAIVSPGMRLPLGLTVDDDVLPRIKDVILRGLLRYSGGLGHWKHNELETYFRRVQWHANMSTWRGL